MIPQPRRSTPFLGDAPSEEPTLGRAASRPRLNTTPSADIASIATGEAESIAIPRRPARRMPAAPAVTREESAAARPVLIADEPVAVASAIAQESIASRESGALRMTAFAACGLFAVIGLMTLARMAETWLLG